MADDETMYCPDCGKEAIVTSDRMGHLRVACKECKSARWCEPAEELHPLMDRKAFSDEDLRKLGIPTDEEMEDIARKTAERIDAGKCRYCDNDAFDGSTVCKKCLTDKHGIPADIVESSTSMEDLETKINKKAEEDLEEV